MRFRRLLPLLATLTFLQFASACGTDDFHDIEGEEDFFDDADQDDDRAPEPLPRVTYDRDGTVEVGQYTFESIEDFQTSEQFWDGGHRCATEHAINPEAMIVNGDAADCSFNFTHIDPRYNPDTVYTIPVVFHVIRRTDGQGHISESLLRSQIDVLNEDFRAMAGSNGAGGNDARIEFVLASQDPNGNPTTGINYHTNNQWFSDPGPGRHNPMKQQLNWDPSRYLNIYTNDSAGALGYATFPQQSAGDYRDGVVLAWNTVGRNNPNGGQFNQGRTATHEVGHYFGLFHTFQDGCGSSNNPYGSGDRIADTPSHRNPDQSCQTRQSSCGTGATPIHNYMNYSPDACMYEFTSEQINRMRCSLVNYRVDLIQVDGGQQSSPGAAQPPEADFGGSIDGLTVHLQDQSSGTDANIVQWHWDFGDGNTSSQSSPSHTYAGSGDYTITLQVTDANGNTDSAAANASVQAPAAGGGELQNNQAESGLNGDAGEEIHFYIDVPADTAHLQVEMFGGTGDADLYVRYGSEPTQNQWDCRPYIAGNDEDCSFENPPQGRWYVMVRGYRTFNNANLVATYSAAPNNSPPADDPVQEPADDPADDPTTGAEPTVLSADNLSAATNQELQFYVELPSNLDEVSFEITGGTGDADLYVRRGAQPTLSNWDYRPYLVGNEESVEVDNPDSGTWHLMVHAYESFNDVTLIVTYQ